MANRNALHAEQTSRDAICSLQPTKMSGIFKGYLWDSQRRLDEFLFPNSAWDLMTTPLPASFISMEEAGRDAAHLSDTESSSSGGGKTPLLECSQQGGREPGQRW